MQPTLMESQHLFVNKLVYNFHDPGRGDIVILKDPDSKLSSPRFLVKRVIGIPGDVIRVEHNHLYVNGELLNEPYTNSDVEDGDYGPFTVEPGHFLSWEIIAILQQARIAAILAALNLKIYWDVQNLYFGRYLSGSGYRATKV